MKRPETQSPKTKERSGSESSAEAVRPTSNSAPKFNADTELKSFFAHKRRKPGRRVRHSWV